MKSIDPVAAIARCVAGVVTPKNLQAVALTRNIRGKPGLVGIGDRARWRAYVLNGKRYIDEAAILVAIGKRITRAAQNGL